MCPFLTQYCTLAIFFLNILYCFTYRLPTIFCFLVHLEMSRDWQKYILMITTPHQYKSLSELWHAIIYCI